MMENLKNRTYLRAEDKFVGSVLVYGDSTDTKLYDGTGSTKAQVPVADATDAFMKNALLIKVGDVVYVPQYVDGVKFAIPSGVSNALVEYSAKSAS